MAVARVPGAEPPLPEAARVRRAERGEENPGGVGTKGLTLSVTGTPMEVQRMHTCPPKWRKGWERGGWLS